MHRSQRVKVWGGGVTILALGGDGGQGVGEVRAGSTSTIPNHDRDCWPFELCTQRAVDMDVVLSSSSVNALMVSRGGFLDSVCKD